MKQILKAALATLLLAGAAGQGHAGSGGHDDRANAPAHAHGRVSAGMPTHAPTRIVVPQRRSRQGHREGRSAGHQDRAFAAAIVGGILGGVAGSQLGEGDGRIVATFAGAVLGALAGHRIGENLADSHHHAPRMARAEMPAYRVQYPYQGRGHDTRTEDHPGRHIRVDQGERPIHF